MEHKEFLSGSMGFGPLNRLLSDLRSLLQEMTVATERAESLSRMVLVTVARILLLLDFVSRNFASADSASRRETMIEGLRFGDGGKRKAAEVIDSAIRLIARVGQQSLFDRTDLEKEFTSQAMQYPAEILAEFVAHADIQKRLFELARRFHELAFRTDATRLAELDVAERSVLGCLLDFFRLERRVYI